MLFSFLHATRAIIHREQASYTVLSRDIPLICAHIFNININIFLFNKVCISELFNDWKSFIFLKCTPVAIVIKSTNQNSSHHYVMKFSFFFLFCCVSLLYQMKHNPPCSIETANICPFTCLRISMNGHPISWLLFLVLDICKDTVHCCFIADGVECQMKMTHRLILNVARHGLIHLSGLIRITWY